MSVKGMQTTILATLLAKATAEDESPITNRKGYDGDRP